TLQRPPRPTALQGVRRRNVPPSVSPPVGPIHGCEQTSLIGGRVLHMGPRPQPIAPRAQTPSKGVLMASIKKRPNGQWRARYRDDAGKEHAKHFARKVDAQRWLDEVTASMVTGAYVDPKAGRVTFASYFAEWAQRQVWE